MTTLATAQRQLIQEGQCPKPGIYADTSFETYQSWAALNHSKLRAMAQSPLHFYNSMVRVEPVSSDALRFGTLLHTLVLEPERFRDATAPAPINEKTGRAYGSETKAWAEYAAARPGKIIVTEEEMERLGDMSHAIRTHKATQVLFQTANQREVCIVWDDPITGMRCKGRVDLLAQVADKSYLRTDLKTCQSANPSELRKSLINYGYHTQDEFYARGFKALGLDSSSMIVAVESVQPHDVVVYRVGDDTRKAAAAQVDEWLRAVAKCEKANHWPGYADGLIDIDAPEWFFKQFADFDN